ncbi:MAG: nucleoside triphosphate pyrophosphohydrolase [Armatimonadetes bacterium]|nr:nucleoside triphosphate pyrophosphohydrolase [Armatimonadota bacterium]
MLTILGLGYGDADALPARNAAALCSGVPVLLRTARHPTVETGSLRVLLDALPPGTVSALDEEYECGASFDETYAAITARVISAAEMGDVVYAVPGHPLWGETTVALVLEEAKRRGIPTCVLSAPSFVDACLEALRMPIPTNLHVLDAHTLDASAATAPPELRASAPILLYQVHSRAVASETKLALMNAGFPDDFVVTVLHAAGIAGQEDIRTVPLFALDRADTGSHSHLTSVFIPALPSETRPPSYYDLVKVMARLRDKTTGCPWDIKQSHISLKKYVIEEAYEVVEAIDALESGDGTPEALADELGDLLLQVVFHAQVAKEAGDFDEADVCRAIVEKLIRRHPHIFGDVVANDAETVLTNWNAIKQAERGNAPKPVSVLDGVNKSLPALSLALETSRRAVKVGFEWENLDAVLAKLDEEIAELREEIAAPVQSVARIESELGDVFFTLVNVARHLGVEPEDALRKQLTRFGARFRFIETKYAGQDLTALSPGDWREGWQKAKENES